MGLTETQFSLPLHFQQNVAEERYHLRKNFYNKFGYAQRRPYGFGYSELAFLRWAISRGVLNSSECKINPGSPWWRAIHDRHIYYSEAAARMYTSQGKVSSELAPIQMWLNYFSRPCAKTWYRAHNSSIIQSYFDARQDAYQENRAEKVLMNVILYRLLYAQYLVENRTRLGTFGKRLADPKNIFVKWFVGIPDYYPKCYPLQSEPGELKWAGNNGGFLKGKKLLDKIFILPRIESIYLSAAKSNKIPGLVKFLDGKIPIYPEVGS